MIAPYTLAAVALSFLFSLVALPYWMNRAREHGLVIADAQKIPARKIPFLAGLIVIFAAVIGILFYIATQTFVYANGDETTVLFAAVTTLLIAMIIGIVDDLLGEKIGLRQYQKPLLTIFATLPIVVINAGENMMTVPFIGALMLGHVYPFVIVPLGIIGASNAFNMLAGVNGLEAGMALIILGTLGYLAGIAGATAAAVIALCMVAAILPFFLLNKYPARILPGDSFTYAAGAGIAVVAIIGNMERAALILFIPYFFEFMLKLRGKFQKESLAKPLPDGGLANKYENWYSLNHVVISLLRKVKGKAREWEVAALLLFMEVAIAAATLAFYI